jgi:pyruvate dehydrogenase E1 component
MARIREDEDDVPARERDPLLTDGLPTQYVDSDPSETHEWLDSFDAVVDNAGNAGARMNAMSAFRVCEALTT